ncbi:MAG: chloride channel protein [Victivallaceae bacterium]|nr:chloride channel protein [Victivallaceae bacterium]
MKHRLIKLHLLAIVRPARFLRRRLGDRVFTLILAVVVGAIVGIAASVLHALVSKIELTGLWIASSRDQAGLGWLGCVALLPFAGIALSFLFQKIFTGLGYAKSLSPLILSISRRRIGIRVSETFTHLVSSALAVGCGGSAGLEAPSVLTGAAIAANTGSFCNVDRRSRRLLIGCGAAAAISAIFNSPVGGVLFAVEVLLPEFSVDALVPMLMSSAVSAVVSRLALPHGCIPIANVPTEWRLMAVPFYVVCGMVCALVGVYVIRSCSIVAGWMKKLLPNQWMRLLCGGSMLCALLSLFPFLCGQGYRFIGAVYSGNISAICSVMPWGDAFGCNAFLTAIVLLVAVLLKSVACTLTVESGGDGGIFAPAMFIGAFTGFAFARLMNLSGIIRLDEANFVVIGMCGVFTSVMRAPLTGIFLIAEVCGGYQLLVPLMIVSAVSWFVAGKFEPYSIYHRPLFLAGLLTSDRDREMLRCRSVRMYISNWSPALSPETPLVEMEKMLQHDSRIRIFPVLEHGKFLGVVRKRDIISALIGGHMVNEMVAFDLIMNVEGTIGLDDDLETALSRMEERSLNFLPVLETDGSFRGFVVRNDIFHIYRKMVRDRDF